jgi:hypothetical protein
MDPIMRGPGHRLRAGFRCARCGSRRLGSRRLYEDSLPDIDIFSSNQASPQCPIPGAGNFCNSVHPGEAPVLVHRELEFVPVGRDRGKRCDILSTTDRGIMPRGFVAIVPIPEHWSKHSGREERGRAITPGPRSGLGPWDGAS